MDEQLNNRWTTEMANAAEKPFIRKCNHNTEKRAACKHTWHRKTQNHAACKHMWHIKHKAWEIEWMNNRTKDERLNNRWTTEMANAAEKPFIRKCKHNTEKRAACKHTWHRKTQNHAACKHMWHIKHKAWEIEWMNNRTKDEQLNNRWTTDMANAAENPFNGKCKHNTEKRAACKHTWQIKHRKHASCKHTWQIKHRKHAACKHTWQRNIARIANAVQCHN